MNFDFNFISGAAHSQHSDIHELPRHHAPADHLQGATHSYHCPDEHQEQICRLHPGHPHGNLCRSRSHLHQLGPMVRRACWPRVLWYDSPVDRHPSQSLGPSLSCHSLPQDLWIALRFEPRQVLRKVHGPHWYHVEDRNKQGTCLCLIFYYLTDLPYQLSHVTADNASNNDTTAQEVEAQLRKCGVTDWKAAERKLG